MLEFSFNDKEDMNNRIRNGDVQKAIYDYLAELIFNNTYYPDMYDNKLSHNTVCDYFEADFNGYSVYSNEINNSENEVASILHDTIINVYEHFISDLDAVLTRNGFILNLVNLQEDLGFYNDEYNTNDLDSKDKDKIVKIAMEYYEKIKDIRF